MKTDYRKKRGIIVQDCSDNPFYNLLTYKDFQNLTKGMMKKEYEGTLHYFAEELSLLEELNRAIYLSSAFNHNINTVSSTDKKLLMTEIQKHVASLLDDIRVLLQYGIDSYIHLSFPYNDLFEQLQKLSAITPSIIKHIDKNKTTRTGNRSGHAINELISRLIVLYEKITEKKAKENFCLPKAQSLPYTGELYNFIYRVFKTIEQKLNTPLKDNPYKINLYSHSLALGKRIEKNLKNPAIVLLFGTRLFS